MRRASLAAALVCSTISPSLLGQQRDWGGFSVGYDLATGETGFVRQDYGSDQLEWVRMQPFVSPNATFGMPFDIPGSGTTVGPGQLILTGLDGTTDRSWMVRVQISVGPPLTLSIVESVDYPNSFQDASDVVYHPTEQRLYVFDVQAGEVLFAPYQGWGQLPNDDAGTWQTAIGPAQHAPLGNVNPMRSMRRSKEPGGGVELFSMGEHLLAFDIEDQPVHLWHDPVAGWQFSVPTATLPVLPNNWQLKEPRVVPLSGVIDLAGAAGAFLIRDVDSNDVVFQGSSVAAGLWQSIRIKQGTFVQGRRYFITSGAGQPFLDSRPFYPQLRLGSPTPSTHFRMGHAQMDPKGVIAGNVALHVSAGIHWADLSQEPVNEEVTAVLWVTVDPPNPPTIQIGGVTVLARVDLQLTESTPESLHSGLWRPAAFGFPIQADLAQPGLTIYFQLLALTSGGELVVSDIVGGTVPGPDEELEGAVEPPPPSRSRALQYLRVTYPASYSAANVQLLSSIRRMLER